MLTTQKRCDDQEICANCLRKTLDCIRPIKDRRSDRITTSETTRLRSEISNLRATLLKVHSLANQADSNGLERIREALRESKPQELLFKSGKKLQVSIGSTTGGSFSIFGPTSAFYDVVDLSSIAVSAEPSGNSWVNLSLLMQCISNFFKWQYPDIATFIHRESFLNDFFSFGPGNQYCSEELVYSVAALGAKCSNDERVRALAVSFFETSKIKIFSKKICQPEICTLQALLCLALYELGDGNASSAWMLSGMAIRMGYDLGFQLNPSNWALTDSGPSNQQFVINMDVLVRSRIYWGCYIFDHFVSLLMGRPVTVRKSEASIPSSENLPNSKDIGNYVFEPREGPGFVANVDPSATIEPLCDLSECIGSLLSDIFSAEYSGDNAVFLTHEQLDEYNEFLSKWRRTLPSEMKWKRSQLKSQSYNPTLMNVRLYYYMVLICINRPFITVKEKNSFKKSPLELCDIAISDLAICLQKFNEAQFPPSVLVIYSSILAISVILLKLHLQTKSEKVSENDMACLRVYYSSISRSCTSWKLASKSLMFMKRKVAELQISVISRVFESAEGIYQDQLTENEVEQILELSDDLASNGQENLWTGFFEFLNHEEGRLT